MVKVLIVVPAYNESKNIEKNLSLLYKTLKKEVKENWKILIAENGSKDSTFQIAKMFAKNNKNVIVKHYDKGSKDNAIIESWINNKVDIYVFTDADNSAHPKYIKNLIEEIKNGTDIAAGYRFHCKENSRGIYRDVISKIYNQILLPIILPTGVRDTQCGMKAVSKRVVENIVPKLGKNNGFFDSELLGVSYSKGYKTKEVPVSWNETRPSVLSVNKNIPNFLKNIVKTRIKIIKGCYN
jgi:glycosyltransferase involved in cell wall biosynthesis